MALNANDLFGFVLHGVSAICNLSFVAIDESFRPFSGWLVELGVESLILMNSCLFEVTIDVRFRFMLTGVVSKR